MGVIIPCKAAAIKASKALQSAMNDAEKAFIHADEPVEAELIFARTCLKAIQEARPALEKYHHIRTILLDIANAIVGVITFGILPLATGRLRFFKETRGKHVLDSLIQIQHTIEPLSPAVNANTECAAP